MNLAEESYSGNEKYRLHIDVIDRQHQAFFEIYDKSLALLAEKKNNIPDEDILKIINDLKDYMKTHFRTEEKLLFLSDYPETDKHIKEHILYIDKIDEFIAAYNYRNPALLDNMLVFMKKWFLSHIKKTDAKYISTLKEYLEKNCDQI